MQALQVRLIVAFLFKLATAKTFKFWLDSTFKIQMSDQMCLLFVR